jgi:hypothetical protein
VNNNRSKQQPPKINLNDLAKHLAPLPAHDHIYPDCPHDTAILIVVTYVDDNLAFSKLRNHASSVCSPLQQMRSLQRLLARWHMSDCNPTKIPCSGKLNEILTQLQQVPAIPDPVLLRDYKELIGSLLFLQTGTIPEISWIVSVLARYMTKAGEPHMAAAKKALRYPQSRKKVPLQWCAIDNVLPGIIHGYPDASFADIPNTRLSSIGYVFLVNGGAISWRCTKTPLKVLNAAEAEIVSLSSAAQ